MNNEHSQDATTQPQSELPLTEGAREDSAADRSDGVPAGVALSGGGGDGFIPPASNRGVSVSLGVDWITASLVSKRRDELWAIWKTLTPQLEFENEPAYKGLAGYDNKKCAAYGQWGVRENGADETMFDGSVNLPGDAIRHLLAAGREGLYPVRVLAAVEGLNFTRLDLAVDVISETVDVRKWGALIEAGEKKKYDSKANKSPKMISSPTWDCGTETIFIGRAKSDRRLRIYNKTKQQEDEGSLDAPEHWTRIEIQLRREYAHKAAAMLLEGGLSVIPGLVADYFSFKGDEAWDAIFKCKLSLAMPRRPLTEPEKELNWILNPQFGIIQKLKIIEMCGLWDHVQRGMEAVQVPDKKLQRWVRAFAPKSPAIEKAVPRD